VEIGLPMGRDVEGCAEVLHFWQACWMKRIAALALSIFSLGAAACPTLPKLEGTAFVETCDPKVGACKSAAEVLYQYVSLPDNDPTVLSIGMQTSPWRFYDADMRIQTAEDLAVMIQPHLTPEIKRIVLDGSWTSVSPDGTSEPLAQKLSKALKGFPVEGRDGFLWIAKDGSLRTTHQAFTMRKGYGSYLVNDGAEIMEALVAGWPSELESEFVKEGNAAGVMRAGAGHDIFGLCPDKALAAFELAAKLSDPIAAYNAAMMRMERGAKGDKEAAIALLEQAENLGDKKALQKLNALKSL
jgi:hypothetical protein